MITDDYRWLDFLFLAIKTMVFLFFEYMRLDPPFHAVQYPTG
jgi:hypothetical protein